MKMKLVVLYLALGLCWGGGNPILADEAALNYRPYFPNFPALTPQEMMAFARSGAAYLEKGGDVQAFNNNPGRFTKGAFLDFRYLGVGNCKSNTVLANPWLPKVVGIKGLLIRVKDARGRAYIAEICAAAKKNPKGAWNVSFIKKPGENRIDPFYQFVVQVKNTDLIVGAYSRNLRLESHLEQRARDEERILNSLLK